MPLGTKMLWLNLYIITNILVKQYSTVLNSDRSEGVDWGTVNLKKAYHCFNKKVFCEEILR